jgi:hypothetical protein
MTGLVALSGGPVSGYRRSAHSLFILIKGLAQLETFELETFEMKLTVVNRFRETQSKHRA